MMSDQDEPFATPDRRGHLRRESDVANAEIVDKAVHDAPIISKLLRTGRVATATLAIGAVFGGACAAIGWRVVRPTDDVVTNSGRIDTNARRIAHQSERTDSLLAVITDMRYTVETIAFIQCVQLRRSDSDLRPRGCDEAVARLGRP